MKKAPAVILAVCAAAALILTLFFYYFKNNGSGPLNIRALPKTEPTVQTQVSPGESAPTASGLVNINAAGPEELTNLPGIGATLAQRIIDYRAEYGPFDSPAGLLNVPGIGEGKLEAILHLITTGGTT